MRYPPWSIPLLVTNCWDALGMIVKCGDIRHHSPLPACAAHCAYHIITINTARGAKNTGEYTTMKERRSTWQEVVFSLVCSKSPSSFKNLLCAEPGPKIRENTYNRAGASCRVLWVLLFMVPLLLLNLLCPCISPWPWWGCNWRVGDIYMGSLITDNTSPDTFLPTQGGGAKKTREGDTNLKSNEATQASYSWHCVCSCVRQESELCQPGHSLIVIEIYACLAATHLTRICLAMHYGNALGSRWTL